MDLYTEYKRGKESKAAVILLHGDLQNHTALAMISTFFQEKGHPVITVDLPGHGLTRFEGSPALKDIITQVIKEHGVKDPIIVGHSTGGIIAANHAKNNKNMTALILINACAGNPYHMLTKEQEIATKQYYKHLSEKSFERQELVDFTKMIDLTEERLKEIGLRTTDPRGFGSNIDFCTTMAMDERRFDIQVPTLLIVSKDDSIMPIQHAKEYIHKMKNARLAIIEKGHNAPLLNPKDVIKALEDNYQFLSGQNAL